jgi:diphthamide synthase (EF-2-diphthine--ammonia ligase)
MTQVFVSWSGGKDCSLALFRALKEGLDVKVLANTITEDGTRSKSHGMSAAVLRDQAEALGLPIRQQPTDDKKYRERFVSMLNGFP